MMFNLSIFDCCTEEEKTVYKKYRATNKLDEKNEIKKELLKSVNEFSGIREISKKILHDKNNEPKISKLIAGFENECVRLSESFIYDKENPKNIPLIKEIVILDCPGTSDKDEYSWQEILLRQLIEEGVLIDGEIYMVYSSSANQMKKRQVCLIQENFFKDNQND